ncbi:MULTISPECIES: hypothetical protein [Agrobacterium]|uniref:Uncharacterized protein n=1 Tax=Agrobacterium tumefaciens TaxID=358 RepID=A0AAE6EF09_AGRTU|nr:MULTISPECIES: hypothetical protein [Agrobacterium]QCL73823.1 hypothetical protein CFBP5499_10600 [Agrobacterium tumefaciens]QCL79398.1 hypothetical protein CFBP5877_10130 [Agrobacterium tumefaciens]CUX36519.1 conserved hypothetical protein [Agrobacterium sp. NCPPB 925]
MKIPGSNYFTYTTSTRNVTSPSGGVAATKPAYAGLADYNSRDNIIFQNLLKNPTVQDNVVLNEDGTYSFIIPGARALSEEEDVIRALIEEQNGDFFQSGDQQPYSMAELTMFRQMTGYNLLQAGGGYSIVDDFGRSVPQDDRQMVAAAWETFDIAKGIQELEAPNSEITIDGLKAVGAMLRDRLGANTELYQHLIDMLTEMGQTTDSANANTAALSKDNQI